MKIAFDAKRALNNSTGLGNHARILLNALMRDFPENDYQLFSPKVRDEFFHQLEGDFKVLMPKTQFEKSFHPIWRSFGITKQLKKERVNIYHGLSNEIPFNTHSSLATVVTIHDLIFLKHTQQYPFIDRQIYTLKTKYAAKHADKIIAISNETRNDLIDFYKVPEQKIEVIYQSVDPAFRNQEQGSRNETVIQKYNLPPKYILNVGSFFPRKNQRTLIEAFDIIKNEVEEDLVLIGGTGSYRKELEGLIHIKKLLGRVKIISNALNQDLPSIYQVASVFVFPSFFEGFGIPVLEALFSKVPVIATKGGAIEEAGGKNSFYINPNSAEQIADAMLKVLSNENLKVQMIESGFVHAQTMTDKTFAENTMKVYREVLAK
ncbi:MAG: glycosyltransferase family 1 protein [Bacteroidota bacterium]